jgi:hypothetical protein
MQAWAGAWTVNKARVRELETQLEVERTERKAPDIADLPMTYRKKFKIALRGLEHRVRQQAHRVLDELFLDDAHSSLDNVLDGRDPRVPRMTGYSDMRPVSGARRKSAKATKH